MSAIGYYRLGYSFFTPRFSTFLKTPTSKLLDGHHKHKVELLTHTHCKTVQELQLKVLASVEVSLDDVKHKKQMTRWDDWFAIIVVLVAVCYCFWKSLGWRERFYSIFKLLSQLLEFLLWLQIMGSTNALVGFSWSSLLCKRQFCYIKILKKNVSFYFKEMTTFLF